MTYPGPSTTGYVYDAFGNRTSMTVGMDTTTYGYDDADRLTSLTPPDESAITYTWDDNGNLTDRGSHEFGWDYEDRMVSAIVDSAETTFAYRGDPSQEGRESRTFNSNTITFTWDIAAGLPVVIDDEDARYVYGAGLVSQVTSSETYYYLSDGLGSTMLTVDSDGDVVNNYTYDVFGETRSESGSQANEFQFAGQQVDGSTGLQYLRARYYNMETGRFMSRDPISRMAGWRGQPFGYAAASPANFSDPRGLDPKDDYDEAKESSNEAEWKWCTNIVANVFTLGDRLKKCRRVGSTLREYAEDLTTKIFGKSLDHGASNAFRHCIWIGMCALDYGPDTARGFGQRHEILDPDDPPTPDKQVRANVDLYNNEFGIRAASFLRKNYPFRLFTGEATQDLDRYLSGRIGERMANHGLERSSGSVSRNYFFIIAGALCALVLIVGIMLAVAGARFITVAWQSSGDREQTEFEGTAWSAADAGSTGARMAMVDDAIRLVEGRPLEDVTQILGEPDESGPASATLWYLIGPEPGLFSVDSIWLVVDYGNPASVDAYLATD